MSNQELYEEIKKEINQDISNFAQTNAYSTMGENGLIIQAIEKIANNAQPISEDDKILANELRHRFDKYCSYNGRMMMEGKEFLGKTQELGRIFSKLTEYTTPERKALINNAINGGIRQTNIGISNQDQFPEGEAARWGVQNEMFREIMKIMTDHKFSNLKSLETKAIVGDIDELVHNESPMSANEKVSIHNRLSYNIYQLLDPTSQPALKGVVKKTQAMVDQMIKKFVAGAENSTLEIQNLIKEGLTEGSTAPTLLTENLRSNTTTSNPPKPISISSSPITDIVTSNDTNPQINYSTNKPTTGIFTRLGNIAERIGGTIQEHRWKSFLIAAGVFAATTLCAIFAPAALPLAAALVGVGVGIVVGKFAYDEYKKGVFNKLCQTEERCK